MTLKSRFSAGYRLLERRVANLIRWAYRYVENSASPTEIAVSIFICLIVGLIAVLLVVLVVAGLVNLVQIIQNIEILRQLVIGILLSFILVCIGAYVLGWIKRQL